ncbi:MAG: hypothetical protein SGPRY_011041, partial [Prymnesium sp.]
AKSAEKAVSELVAENVIAEASVESISAFLMRNDGKLDQSKIGDYLGGSDEINRGVSKRPGMNSYELVLIPSKIHFSQVACIILSWAA